MNDWIAVFETSQLYQAEMVKDILADNGVETVVLNQQDSSYKFGDIRVMVREEVKEQAVEIIKSIRCE